MAKRKIVITPNDGKCEETGLVMYVDRNTKLHRHFGKQFGSFL
jgi:hypothetical protein